MNDSTVAGVATLLSCSATSQVRTSETVSGITWAGQLFGLFETFFNGPATPGNAYDLAQRCPVLSMGEIVRDVSGIAFHVKRCCLLTFSLALVLRREGRG